MGRINLTALQVRKRALANLETKRTRTAPSWLDVVGDVPPAQILTRQQPIQHPLTQVRARRLSNGRVEQYTQVIKSRKPKSSKPSKLFSPVQLKYEEDALRHRFFSDHPWELARPRVVLETSGDQYRHADWSTGLIQPGVPLSGESVVQRQLWLLHNVPDITVAQAYDMARKEFYLLRRQEETRRRIAAEEAEHMGAQFGKSENQISMQIENETYNDWERWSRQQVSEQMQRNAAFDGTAGMEVEESASPATEKVEKPAVARDGITMGRDVFGLEAQRRAQFIRRES